MYLCMNESILVIKICSIYSLQFLTDIRIFHFKLVHCPPPSNAVSAVNLVVHSSFSLLIVRIGSSFDSLEERAAVREDDLVDSKMDVLDLEDPIGKESTRTELDLI